MNLNPDQPSREDLELRITALLLGELPAGEAASLRETIAQDPALKKFHDEMAAAIGLVAETVKAPADAAAENAAPLQLAAEKREQLLAHFQTPRPGESFWIKPMKLEMPSLPKLVYAALVIVFVMGLVAISLPNFVKARSTSRANAVINNLRQIDAAKDQWALENKKSPDAVPTPEDLKPYLAKGVPAPVSGESYVLGKVSEPALAEIDASQAKKQLGGLATQMPRGGSSDQRLLLSSDGSLTSESKVESQKQVAMAFKRVPVAPAPVLAPPPTSTPTTIVLPSTEQPAPAAMPAATLNDTVVAQAAPAAMPASAFPGATRGVAPDQVPSQPGKSLADSDTGGVYSQNIVGYVNQPLSNYISVNGSTLENAGTLQAKANDTLTLSGSAVSGTTLQQGLASTTAGSTGGGAGGDNRGAVVGVVNAYAGVSGANGGGINRSGGINGLASNGTGGGTRNFGGFGGGGGGGGANNQPVAQGGSQLGVPDQSAGIVTLRSQNSWTYATGNAPVPGQAGELAQSRREPAEKTWSGPATIDPSTGLPVMEQRLERVEANFNNGLAQNNSATSELKPAERTRALSTDKKTDRSDFAKDESFTPAPGQNKAVGFDWYLGQRVQGQDSQSALAYREQEQAPVLGDIPQTGHLTTPGVSATPPTGMLHDRLIAGADSWRSFDGSVNPPVVSPNTATLNFGLNSQPPPQATAYNGLINGQNSYDTPVSAGSASAVPDSGGTKYYFSDTTKQPGTEAVYPPGMIDFSSADVGQVLDLYGKLTGRTVIHSALPDTKISTSNLTSQKPMTRDEAIEKLQAVLAQNNISVIPMGDKFLKVVQTDQANGAGGTVVNKSASGTSIDVVDRPAAKVTLPAPVPQPEILTRENAFSTFSLNVSDVSFKLAQASLEQGKLPDPAGIRSEEFINAFDYRDPEAAMGKALAFAAERARYPFAQNRELLRFSVKTAAAGRPAGRALNLVLLLDNSGSMERADRVAIIREALRVLTTQLQPGDTVSVVTFARTARLWADGLPGDQAAATLEKVGEITPEGGTNLEEAMRLAYETAQRHYLANGMNRVVLLTDGAANLGNVDPGVLRQKVEAERKQGIALDCFGIGFEDYDDTLLEELSSHGDGRYAFLNSPEDVTQEFAAKLAGALQIAASDVKVQVEFNPDRVTAYRQIGYAKHQLTKEQFRDNTVNAAQIAAQEAGNALYTVETRPDGTGPVATVRVRYRVPGTADYHEWSWEVPYEGVVPPLENASPAMRLAGTASAFSEWLAASPYAQEVTPNDLLKILSGVPEVYGADERPKKLEWMIRQAQSLSGK